jgi:hypothetical protein
MEGYFSTGQSSQWAIVPMEEEEVKGCTVHSFKVGQPSIVSSSREFVKCISSYRAFRVHPQTLDKCWKAPTSYDDIGRTSEDST